MMGKKILLVGEAMVLLTATQEGSLDQAQEYHVSTAGAELNVAIGLVRLGHDVTYYTRLGQDPFGQLLERRMRDGGIGTGRIAWDGERRTGMMLKGRAPEGEDPDISYFRKGSAASAITPEEVAQLDLTEYGALHMTGIFPALSETAREAAFLLMRRAKEAGLTIFFDPNLRLPLWKSEEEMKAVLNELASFADYVLPGLKEGRMLTGRKNPEEIAAFYHRLGSGCVVIKLGTEGAFYARPEGSGWVAGYQADYVVDTVGAGDGFAAGVISAVLEGLPAAEAVRRGNAIGCLQVMNPGDNEGLPDREQLAAFQGRQGEDRRTGEDRRRTEEDRRRTGEDRRETEEGSRLGQAAAARKRDEEARRVLEETAIIPVIKVGMAEQAVPLMRALLDGGIRVAEITFRSDAAEAAIAAIAAEVPEAFVCAGTVLNVETAERAVRAGAKAVISPGMNPEVVRWCLERGIPVIPGCATPTEVEACMRLGLRFVKFFPAEAAGGIAMLKAFAGPYADMKFMPTGGISPENLKEYLSLNNVVACGGSFIVPEKALEAGDYEEIRRRAQKARGAVGKQ